MMLRQIEVAPITVERARPSASGRSFRRLLSTDLVLQGLRVADVAAVLVAGIIAYVSRFPLGQTPQPLEFYALFIGLLLALHVFQAFGLYRAEEWGRLLGGRLLAAWALVVVSLITLGYLTKTGYQISRLWAGLWFIYTYLAMIGLRLVVFAVVKRWQRAGVFTRHVAIIGSGTRAAALLRCLELCGDGSVTVVGLFGDRTNGSSPQVPSDVQVREPDELLRYARHHPLDQAIIALEPHEQSRLGPWLMRLRDLPIDVSVTLHWLEKPFRYRRLVSLGEHSALMVLERPLSGMNRVVKEVQDCVLATIFIVLTAPLMLLIAVLIRLDSPGPILFRQKRYGFNNEVIDVLKFRTMFQIQAGQDEGQVIQTRRSDPRVTRAGRLLRRTSLDELPQLFNVLKGQMSLVGPRPHAVIHNDHYGHMVEAYFARHRVKPGITGWAQVNGFRGPVETLDQMEMRIRHDLYYIENWSFWLDLRILVRTLLVGFVHKNAY